MNRRKIISWTFYKNGFNSCELKSGGEGGLHEKSQQGLGTSDPSQHFLEDREHP
jgi:hypothetical protein